jgi:hypothetical protein
MTTTYMHTCIGEMNEILDIPLPQPFDDEESTTFSFSSLGKLHKKSPNGNKLYKYDYNSINELYDVCKLQTLKEKTYKISKYIDIKFKSLFNTLEPGKKYAVKVIKADTIRSMVAGLKEASVINEIFTLSDDLVSKPFFCSPFWKGNSWVYVIVTEFLEGNTINDIRVMNIFTSKKQKEEIKNTIVSTVYQLWWNGYSHNNLLQENIIYNSKTKSVKFVGLSNCVAIPFEYVSLFQTNISNCDITMMREYQNTFKKQSILLAGNTTDIQTDDMAISAYYF